MALTAALAQMIAVPEVPLDARYRSQAQARDLRHARDLDARDPDSYWEWVAQQMRWQRPWDTVRSGGFGDLRYFEGGCLNVCDNCVDRHAEDAARAVAPAVIWEGEPGETRQLTYAELRCEVARLANGLRSLGVGEGDVVAIYMQNLPEAIVAIHACNRIGAVYTVLFAGFSADAVALRLRTAGAKAVIVADISYRRGREVPLLQTLRAAAASAPELEHVVVVDRSGASPALRSPEIGYRDLVDAQSDECPCVALEANAPAFLIFTSGTSSAPKGLVHSVAGFLLGTWANVKWQINLTRDDVYWCAADVGWLTFPIHAVVGGLAHGGTVVCYEGSYDTPTNARFYEIAERHRVTKILTAPTALRMLRGFGEELAAEHALPQLELLTVQGEPLDAETFGWASRHVGGGVPVVNAYGQTETGSTWTHPIAGVDGLKPGSCGRPVPGHRCSVVDDRSTPVAPGTRGNLVLDAPFPTLARTIWRDHDRYLSSYFADHPGRYHTSDEAVIDADGHLWVLGRSDDVINVAGHRLSTIEIESAIAADPMVAEAAVVGVQDGIKGLVPVAFVVTRSDRAEQGLQERLSGRVEEAIGGIARLQRVYVTTQLPKTRAGKIMRRLLRDVAQDGQARGDTTGLEDPAALGSVVRAVRADASRAR